MCDRRHFDNKSSSIMYYSLFNHQTATASQSHYESPHSRALSENIDNVIDNFLQIDDRQATTTVYSPETPIDRSDLLGPFGWLDKFSSSSSLSSFKDQHKKKQSKCHSLKFKLCSKQNHAFGEICLELTKSLDK